MGPSLAVVLLAATTTLLAPAAFASAPSAPVADAGFGAPQPVTIDGYSAGAMEPFISRDGHDLFFNTTNQSPDIPAIQLATRVSTQEFTYQGPLAGANDPPALSATPSMDDAGTLYFISTRSYPQTLSTVYAGTFAAGQLTAVHLVAGVSAPSPGTVDFDVEVSPDGSTLYVSVGQFGSGSTPTGAGLAVYDKTGSSFVLDPQSARILHAVNRKGILTYAASISSDGLELFFTRAKPTGGHPSIYRAVRSTTGGAFGHVQRLADITGFAEAPSLSADGSTLYYHLLVGSRFDIESVSRGQ
ncbi:MAG TPA: hypothetical protein VID75_03305 [Acidimicrobiales bacterium]